MRRVDLIADVELAADVHLRVRFESKDAGRLPAFDSVGQYGLEPFGKFAQRGTPTATSSEEYPQIG